MATTFQQVASACNGDDTCFVNSSDIQSWASTTSQNAQVPRDLILAQWIYEGAPKPNDTCTSCNNPGNVEYGTFSGCGTSYSTSECSAYPSFGYASTGLAGAQMMAGVYNARFCSVSNAYMNSVGLTSGGSQLFDYAQAAGWETLVAQTYDAAYALGTSGWAASQYTSNYIGASPASSVPGSGLIYMIHMHNLAQYDNIG